MHDMSQTTTAMVNPFLDDVFVAGRTPLPGSPDIHQPVLSRCISILESLTRDAESKTWNHMGRTVLISAPRAGFGKSHLMGRLRSTTESVLTGIDLPFDPSRSITWPVILASVLRQYRDYPSPRDRGCSLLEETTRFFLAHVVRAALASDEIAEKSCPENEVSLAASYRQIFDRSSKSKILAWTAKRSTELADAAAPRFRSRWGLGPSEVAFWTRLSLACNEGETSALDSLRGLSNGEARQRTLQFLRIASECRPVVLVADHLDGFYGSESAGMAIAEILTSIRSEVTKCVTLLCLNEDLWKSVFEHRLPTAWLDRLTGETAALCPVDPAAAHEIVVSRLDNHPIRPESAQAFASFVARENGWHENDVALYPREVIRQAREVWDRCGFRFIDAAERGTPAEPVEDSPATPPVSSPPPLPANLERDEPSPAERGGNPRHDSREGDTRGTYPDRESPPPSITPPAATFTPPIGTPFDADRPRSAPADPAEIDSIIDDIRGSGSSVFSEPHADTAASPPPPGETAPSGPGNETVEPAPSLSGPPANGEGWQAGDIRVRPLKDQSEPATDCPPDFALPKAPPESPRTSLESRLREHEALYCAPGRAVPLDLKTLERFVRRVGMYHTVLGQSEESFAGAGTTCLRWRVHDHPVFLGFEPPRNVYFWNSLLRHALDEPERGKVAGFSHRSIPFNPELFDGFGFPRDVVLRHVDIIELNDRELGMIYAAATLVDEARDVGEADAALNLITRRLDPLWRRIGQPMHAR